MLVADQCHPVNTCHKCVVCLLALLDTLSGKVLSVTLEERVVICTLEASGLRSVLIGMSLTEVEEAFTEEIGGDGQIEAEIRAGLAFILRNKATDISDRILVCAVH